MTEAQARNKVGNIRVFMSDFRAMKNVLANRNERVLYKMIVDATTDKVVASICRSRGAGDLTGSGGRIKAGLTKRDFDRRRALHPTIAEELVLLR